MLTLGGYLKKKENLSARLGDVLSCMYLASMVLKHHETSARSEDLPIVEWACRNLLYQAQEQLHGFLRNFPNRFLASVMRTLIFPNGLVYSAPADRLGRKVAALVTAPSEARARLGDYVYRTSEPTNALAHLQEALLLAVALEPLEKRIRVEGVKAGKVTALDLPGRIQQALAVGLITETEAAALRDYDRRVMALIHVDDFDPPALGTRSQPAREIQRARGMNAPAPLASLPPALPAAPAGTWQRCENCGNEVTQRYCGACGQRLEPPVHSLWHFSQVATEDLTHADSRLWRTLGALLFKPGHLTAEFLAGRRARYLPPLRLYLVLSVVFFLVASAVGTRFAVVQFDDSKPLSEARGSRSPRTCRHCSLRRMRPRSSAPTGCARTRTTQRPWQSKLQPAFRQACRKSVIDNGHELQVEFLHNIPRAMFVFLPLLAGPHDAPLLAAAALLRGAPAAVRARPCLRVPGGRAGAAGEQVRAARSRPELRDLPVLCLVRLPLHAGRLPPGPGAHGEQARAAGVLLPRVRGPDARRHQRL